MSVDILVRFTDEQATRLKAERARTLVPTSAFIRKAVAAALDPDEPECFKNLDKRLAEEERRNAAKFHGEKP
jgi:hypothetical protein